MTLAPPLMAQTPTVSVGAGLQTALVVNSPSGGSTTTQFPVPSVRLYFNGTAAEHVKFMLNTEYKSGPGTGPNEIGVLDAVAQFSTSPQMNLWVGRFLPPSDRANLYGPYYSHHWAVYQDGIQDGYPFLATGRDNGAMYWGQFNKVKLSVGAFDGATTTGNTDVLGAARVQVDLWDSEDGYYLNGTYYGAKNLLALGFAAQAQDGNTACNFDFLLEKKLKSGGVVSLESQYNKYDQLGGYGGFNGTYKESDGAYVLASYLFPQMVGAGKVELLGKFAGAQFEAGTAPNYTQKTTEIDVNYLIKEFNARVMFFFLNKSYDNAVPDNKQFGVGVQIQM